MPRLRRRNPLRCVAGTAAAVVACLGMALAAEAAARLKEKALASSPPRLLPASRAGATPRLMSAAASAALVVKVADLNSRTTIERSECVIVATGVRSAYECGDLRMVHPLPVFRTMNRPWAPVLMYNSQHANPRPTVYANVTLPAGAQVPTAVQAAVVIDGATVATASWPGAGWQPGTTRRVAVQWDGLNTPTGLYPYDLQVTAVYGGAQVPSLPAKDTMAVVNRQASPFGEGWWLSGWEQLVPFGTGFLWVGGDGSTRRFVPDGTSRWTAWNPAGAPHVLLRSTGANGATWYHRPLRGGGEVTFDGQGRHVRTLNRLGQSTGFTLSGGRLGSINLPVAGGGYPAYVFGYDTEGRLAHVAAHVMGGPARVTYVGYFGVGDRRVAALQDPDGNGVTFGYDAQVARRISGYNDRRMTWTSFTFDAAGKMSASRLWMASTPSVNDIVRGFQAGESWGVGGSVPAADVHTLIDGARTDVADHTRLWLTDRGAPSRVRDALGHETLIFRDSANTPAVVTRTVAPNGFTQRADVNARGNVMRTITENARGDGVSDVTRYEYDDPAWPDFPTRIVPPEGDSVVIAYRPDGSRAWQMDARGRVAHFRYYETGVHRGLVRATDLPETPPDSIVYDGVLGNLWRTRTPLGAWTTHETDLAGRPVKVTSDIALVAGDTLRQWQETWYDAMGRDTLVRAEGPPVPYSLPWAPAGAPSVLAEATELRRTYDGEGNVLSVWSTTSAPGGADVYSAYTYDRAGRKLTEYVGQKLTTWAYDAAGNVDSTWTNRGLATRMWYDAANRLAARVLPPAVYPAETCAQHGLLNPCTYRFPLYPNTTSGGLMVPGDTATFTYDANGNLLTANNRAARIRRTYTPGGLLATDTLRIRVYGAHATAPCAGLGCPPQIESVPGGMDAFETTVASISDPYPSSEFTTHVYGLGYRYDRNGRLKDLLGPASISAAFGRDSTRYGYNAAGELSSVRDPLGNAFAFVYDGDGRPVQTVYPGGVTETRAYDADGRLVHRRAAGSWLVHEDSIQYDLRGKALRVVEAWGSNVIHNRYSGLGTLVASSYGGAMEIPTVEEYRSDPLGHMYWSRTRDPETGNAPEMAYAYAPNASAVVQTSSINTQSQTQTWHPDTTYTRLDAAGNVLASGQRSYRTSATEDGVQISLVSSSATRHYYAADEKLRFLQKYHWTGQARKGTFDEYRYDALGRRVLQRMRRDSLCTGSECTSAIERYVWSGDQLLYEIRAPGGDNATAAQMESDVGSGDEFGRVGYTHAAGIDAPLSVIRTGHVSGNVTLVPHSDYRGTYHAASTASGGMYDCGPADPCLYVVWPKPFWGSWFKGGNPAAGDWVGSLVRGQQDISGLMYRRNRYYDPQTGQFTQSDPIGIAGGLNTYGFGNGDPVSYADPYGLCAENSDTDEGSAATDTLTTDERNRVRCVIRHYTASSSVKAGLLWMLERDMIRTGVHSTRQGNVAAWTPFDTGEIVFSGGPRGFIMNWSEREVAKTLAHEYGHLLERQGGATRALDNIGAYDVLKDFMDRGVDAFAQAVTRSPPDGLGGLGGEFCPVP